MRQGVEYTRVYVLFLKGGCVNPYALGENGKNLIAAVYRARFDDTKVLFSLYIDRLDVHTQDMFRLANRICKHNDILSSWNPDAFYPVAETRDNQMLALMRCQELYRRNSLIAITDGDEKNGYVGFNYSQEYLSSRGICKDDIVRITSEELAVRFNTLTEVEAVIRHAKVAQWRMLFVVGAAFHHLRAYITFVSVALREYPDILLISVPGYSGDWNKRVLHSQGIVSGTRMELLMGELDRLADYYADSYATTRHLAPPDAILAYMDRREK